MLQIRLSDRQYNTFIRYALATCDCFSLVFPKSDIQKTVYVHNEPYERIKAFVIKTESIGIHPDTGTTFDHSDIVYFLCNKQSGSILFSLGNLIEQNGYASPTELCFYRNGKPWFLSINHEGQAIIVNAMDDDLRFLKDTHIDHCNIGKRKLVCRW